MCDCFHLLSQAMGENPRCSRSSLGKTPHLYHHRPIPWPLGDFPWLEFSVIDLPLPCREKSNPIPQILWVEEWGVWWKANIYESLVDVELLPHQDTMVKADVVPNYEKQDALAAHDPAAHTQTRHPKDPPEM